MHKIWNNTVMGENITDKGYPAFEIDKSELFEIMKLFIGCLV